MNWILIKAVVFSEIYFLFFYFSWFTCWLRHSMKLLNSYLFFSLLVKYIWKRKSNYLLQTNKKKRKRVFSVSPSRKQCFHFFSSFIILSTSSMVDFLLSSSHLYLLLRLVISFSSSFSKCSRRLELSHVENIYIAIYIFTYTDEKKSRPYIIKWQVRSWQIAYIYIYEKKNIEQT